MAFIHIATALSMGIAMIVLVLQFFQTDVPMILHNGTQEWGTHGRIIKAGHLSNWSSVSAFPQEYQRDDEISKCFKIFSQSYLASAASLRSKQCDKSSVSRLDCFHAPREPVPHAWPLDTFCVAQGVQYSQDLDGAFKGKFSLQCPLDGSFGAGQQNDTIKTPKDYFFYTGVTNQLADWESTSSNTTQHSQGFADRKNRRNNGFYLLKED